MRSYTKGPSTPRPIRFNDQLWQDFAKVARRRGIPISQLLRDTMLATIKRDRATGHKYDDLSPVDLDD